MKKTMLSIFVCVLLQTVYASTDTIYIIGQTHVVDGPLFFDSSYQRELIESQKKVKEVIVKESFSLIGDEGLSEEYGSTVYTIKEYIEMPLSEKRYRAVPWLLHKGFLKPEQLVGIEHPLLHEMMQSYEGIEEEYSMLQKERSQYFFFVFTEAMKKRNLSKGALIVGSSHIRQIKEEAQKKGYFVVVQCTSRNPEKYL